MIRRQAVFSVSLVAVLWGLPPLFIHYFALYLDAHTQNFWRYVSALLFLLVYLWWSGERLSGGGWRALTRPAVAAAGLVSYQTCFTLSLYYAMPALISLLLQLELVVAIALSCLFFADERRVARSGWFIAGACAAFLGAVGMVVFSREFAAGAAEPSSWGSFTAGVLLVGGAAVLWATYSVAIKWCFERMSPLSAFVRVEIIATGMLLVIAAAAGDLGAIARLPAPIALLLVGSGVVCIAIAHLLYTPALHRLGVVVCNTVVLTSPVVAAVASRIIFGERLTGGQMIAAIVLLGGAAAAVQARRGNGRRVPSDGAAENAGQGALH